jgi:hypothetical protein
MLTIDMALALLVDAEAAALASFSPSMSMERKLVFHELPEQDGKRFHRRPSSKTR